MSHDIKPSPEHTFINLQIVLHSMDTENISDELNKPLLLEIGNGFLAYFAFYNTDSLLIVTSTDTPVEGELFECLKSGTIYPDMDLKAEELAHEYFELVSNEAISQKVIDSVDYIAAEVASGITHCHELISAIQLLKYSHPQISEFLTNICDSYLVRDHIQKHAF